MVSLTQTPCNDKISLMYNARLGKSKAEPTYLDHQQGSEVYEQVPCTKQKSENTPLEQEEHIDGNPELQAEHGCPVTHKHREMLNTKLLH